jgi:hypothetical protein
VGEFLVTVEEQLDASQTRVLGLELEPPLDGFGGKGIIWVGVGRGDVSDFGGDFVRGDSIAAWPAGGRRKRYVSKRESLVSRRVD